MSIPLPQLDNLSFEELVDEARGLIPALSPNWTDHNPSDPGMTLVELFAWMSEMLIYRSDQITPEHQRTFLRLLDGDVSPVPEETDSVEEQRQLNHDIAQTMLGLRERYRTVTSEDYELISLAASNKIARTKCIPRRNLDSPDKDVREQSAPGHVSIMILPVQRFDYIFPAIEQRELFKEEGEFLYLGLREQTFDGIQLELLQSGKAYELECHYHNGSGWQALPIPLLDAAFHSQKEGIAWLGQTSDWARNLPADLMDLMPEGETVEAAYWLRINNSTGRTDSRRKSIAKDIFPRVLQPSSELITALETDLEPRRLLATHNHVVGPIYAPIDGEIILAAHEDILPEKLQVEILGVLNRYLDPLLGGSEGLGWPFGRSIYVSELYALLESINGVDYIGDLELSSPLSTDPRHVQVLPYWHEDGEMIGLALEDHHLPMANFTRSNIIVASALIPLSVQISGIEITNDLPESTNIRMLKREIKNYFSPLSSGVSKDWKIGGWQVNDSAIADILTAAFSEMFDLDNMRIDLYGPSVEVDTTNEHRYIAEFHTGQLADVRLIADDLLS